MGEIMVGPLVCTHNAGPFSSFSQTVGNNIILYFPFYDTELGKYSSKKYKSISGIHQMCTNDRTTDNWNQTASSKLEVRGWSTDTNQWNGVETDFVCSPVVMDCVFCNRTDRLTSADKCVHKVQHYRCFVSHNLSLHQTCHCICSFWQLMAVTLNNCVFSSMLIGYNKTIELCSVMVKHHVHFHCWMHFINSQWQTAKDIITSRSNRMMNWKLFNAWTLGKRQIDTVKEAQWIMVWHYKLHTPQTEANKYMSCIKTKFYSKHTAR